MKKLILRVFVSLFTIVFLAVSLELAFDLRHWLESFNESHDSGTAKKRILFIGDSILGFLGEPNSAAAKTLKFLSETHPGEFSSEELSAPALETDRIVELLPDSLHQFRPDIVVMMIGKSDTPHLVKDKSYDRWFRRLRIYRLAFVIYLDLAQKLSRFRTQYLAPEGPITDIRKAWIFFGQKNCVDSLPYFERALSTGAINERNLKGAAVCYRTANQIPRGISFLGKLKVASGYGDLVRFLIQSLSVELNRTSPEKNKLVDNFLDQDALQEKSRDFFRTNLWLYKVKDDRKGFAHLFRSIPPEATDPLLEVTQKNMKRILNEIGEIHAKIVLVQYPLDDSAYLKKVFSDSDDAPEILNARDWLINDISEEKMADCWTEDIEHVTPLGAEVLGRNLAKAISK